MKCVFERIVGKMRERFEAQSPEELKRTVEAVDAARKTVNVQQQLAVIPPPAPAPMNPPQSGTRTKGG